MALIAVEHDGTDVTNDVINFERNQSICSGIGTLRLTIQNANFTQSYAPWDEIVLYEYTNKVGTYRVVDVQRSFEDATLTVSCQDNSKKLVDYFITDNYIIDYASTARYWIEKFLDEAGVAYSITASGDGSPISNNATLGMSSAFDIIQTLLQQSGWYMYFNQNGTAIIGNISADGGSANFRVDDTEVLTVHRMRNDSRLRNRAVVWGTADPVNNTWVFADESVNTPWNYDANDKRAVVFAHSMIGSIDVAEDLARRILREFARITNEITVEVVTSKNIKLGQILAIRSREYNGRGLVTSIGSMGSKDGFIKRITINQRCPRLFAYFGYDLDLIPVYIGTWGSGVWWKYTGGNTWMDASTGLENLYIKDLFIKSGVMVCVADDGFAYIGDIETNTWEKVLHGGLSDTDGVYYDQASIKAQSCSINIDGRVVVGYNYTNGFINRSWILEYEPLPGMGGVILKAESVTVLNSDNQVLIDLEAQDDYNIVSTVSRGGAIESLASIYSLGDREVQPYSIIDDNAYNVGFEDGWAGTILTLSQDTNYPSRIIERVNGIDYLWYLSGSGADTTLHKYNLTSMTPDTTYTIENSNLVGAKFWKRNDTQFVFMTISGTSTTLTTKLYSYTLGNSTYVDRGTFIYDTEYSVPIYTTYLLNSTAITYVISETFNSIAYEVLRTNLDGYTQIGQTLDIVTVSDTAEKRFESAGYGLCVTTEGAYLVRYTTDAYKNGLGEYNLIKIYRAYYEVNKYGNGSDTEYEEIYRYYPPADNLPTTISPLTIATGAEGRIGYVYALYEGVDTDIYITDAFIGGGTGIYEDTGKTRANKSTPSLVTYSRTHPPYNLYINYVDGKIYITDILFMTLSSFDISIYNDIAIIPSVDDADGTIYVITDTPDRLIGLDNTGTKTKERLYGVTTLQAGYLTLNYLNFTGKIDKLGPTDWLLDIADPKILHHSHDYNTTSSASLVAEEKTTGVFATIYENDYPMKVEISKGTPTVVYSTPDLVTISGVILASGTLTPPFSGYVPVLAASVSNTDGSFYSPTTVPVQMTDARTFDIPDPGTFYFSGGYWLPDSLLERYTGIVSSGNLIMTQYEFTGEWYNIGNDITVSGCITKVETTNYTESPYIFIATSGNTNFYQRGPDNLAFYESNINLPSSEITIIRVDDDV